MDNEADKSKEKLPEFKNDKVLISMLAICFVLLVAIITVQFLNAPSFGTPVYTPSQSTVSSESTSSGEFPIGINSATYYELQTIPGVGPSTARLIAKYREENGTITEFEDLLKIEGIGEKTVELFKEYCIVD